MNYLLVNEKREHKEGRITTSLIVRNKGNKLILTYQLSLTSY